MLKKQPQLANICNRAFISDGSIQYIIRHIACATKSWLNRSGKVTDNHVEYYQWRVILMLTTLLCQYPPAQAFYM